MFSFFRKQAESTRLRDIVFIDDTSRLNALDNLLSNTTDAMLVCWFEDDRDTRAAALPHHKDRIWYFRDLHSPQIRGNRILFTGHYPLPETERKWFESSALKEAVVYSSLNDPLLKHFGGERITGLLKTLGMKPGEPIEHKFISSSIKNAQDKIAAKVTNEHRATIAEEWFARNLPTR